MSSMTTTGAGSASPTVNHGPYLQERHGGAAKSNSKEQQQRATAKSNSKEQQQTTETERKKNRRCTE
jgi:hypothetical protein